MSIYIGYFVGLLIVVDLLACWFQSTIRQHILNKIFNPKPKLYTNQDFLEWSVDQGWAGELLNCPLCLGHWISGVVAALLVLINGYSPWFIVCAALTWPALAAKIVAHGPKSHKAPGA